MTPQTHLDLYIASGLHVANDLTERREKIESEIGAPQHIFKEGEETRIRTQIKVILRTLPVAPLVAIAAFFQLLILNELVGRIVSIIGGDSAGRDDDLVADLKNRHGIDSSEVDISLLPFIFNYKMFSVTSNWSAIFFLSYTFWAFNRSIAYYLTSFLVVGYVLLMILLGISFHTRNRSMADNIIEASNQFERTCMVTGEAHHAAVAKLLEDTTSVNVLNPEPDEISLQTQISLYFLTLFGHIQNRIDT